MGVCLSVTMSQGSRARTLSVATPRLSGCYLGRAVAGRCRDSSDFAEPRCYPTWRIRLSRRRRGETPGRRVGATLASRRSDRSPAPSPDRDAGPAIAVASSDTATLATAITYAIAHSVPAATSATSSPATTTTSTSATTFG